MTDVQPTYEANTVPELQAELDRRKLEYKSGDLKADLIKLLEDDDGGKAPGKSGPDEVNPAAADSELVPTEAGDPPLLTGEDVIAVERSDTRGVALGDIPLLDPRATVGEAPKIPEGFESAAASARGSRAEVLATTLGQHGIEDVQAAMDIRNSMADASGGEVLIEASGPVATTPADDTTVYEGDLAEV